MHLQRVRRFNGEESLGSGADRHDIAPFRVRQQRYNLRVNGIAQVLRLQLG